MSNANSWRVQEIQPQPCLMLRKRAWKRRAPVTTKLVGKSAVGRVTFQSLEGVIYGPDGTPLADALVHLRSINRSTRTGRHGEFKFESVPAVDLKELLVEAQGREIVIDAVRVAWPLAIHFHIEE